MIKISENLYIEEDDIDVKFIRSPGPGGQHVNKVESAVQIRFDAKNCPAFSEDLFVRLQKLSGQRMTNEGIIIITSNSTRSQLRNREEALAKLVDLIKRATIIPKKRKKTKPTFGSKTRRLDSKTRKAALKSYAAIE